MDRPVLFSYRHAGQKDFVAALEDACRALLVNTWRDDKVPPGETPEAHVSGLLTQVDTVLLFVSGTTFDGLTDPTSGLYREVRRLVDRRAEEQYRLVLVDLVGYSARQIASFPFLGGGTEFTLRLMAADAYSAFVDGTEAGDAPRLIRALAESISDLLGGVDLFPRHHATLTPGVYRLSSGTARRPDHVRLVPTVLAQEANDHRPLLPTRDASGQTLLVMDFEHHAGKESFWAGVIGFDSDLAVPNYAPRGARGEWIPRDLRGVRSLEIDMRLTGSDVPCPVRIRLEDDALSALPGSSFHQSTGWSPPGNLVGENFRTITVDLDADLDWGANAFRFNTAAPDRSRILQITFGHDIDDADARGAFEIRSIRVRAG